MNQEEIKKILPHRDHMLLIDEAELREGKAYGKKTIRGDEFFLQGHFPGNPVVPGVILCEILGQSACVLLSGEAEGITPFFTGLDKVRFKNPVHPGALWAPAGAPGPSTGRHCARFAGRAGWGHRW